MKRIRLGCVADDFTGASDAASFLAKSGLETLLICSEPEDEVLISSADAIVVALKSRTAPAKEAKRASMDAFEWLRKQGCNKFYFKYCSTFDSSEKGNIGVVTDAFYEKYGVKYTVLCPALIVNGRTVKDGKLYVGDVLLENSGMRNHPLTPMRHSDIKTLIEMQSKYDCLVITHEDYMKGKEYILEKISDFGKEREHFHISVDFFLPEHGEMIMDIFSDIDFLTGGSGIMEHMSTRYWTKEERSAKNRDEDEKCSADERRVILAGSCSDMTKKQIRRFKNEFKDAVRIDVASLKNGETDAEAIWHTALEVCKKDILIYSADENSVTNDHDPEAAQKIEECMSELAKLAANSGIKRIVVAGGETSGAVVSALGLKEFAVLDSVAPGVPKLMPLANPDMRMVLKSGNFGDEEFFIKALA